MRYMRIYDLNFKRVSCCHLASSVVRPFPRMKEDLGASWVVIRDVLVPVDALGCRLVRRMIGEESCQQRKVLRPATRESRLLLGVPAAPSHFLVKVRLRHPAEEDWEVEG
jgi:hypothetical protein